MSNLYHDGPGTDLVRLVKAHRKAFGSDLKQAKDAVQAGWRDGQLDPRDAEIARLREALSDVVSHESDWRKALELMRDLTVEPADESDDRAYWQHQLNVLDRIVAALAPDPVEGEEK